MLQQTRRRFQISCAWSDIKWLRDLFSSASHCGSLFSSNVWKGSAINMQKLRPMYCMHRTHFFPVPFKKATLCVLIPTKKMHFELPPMSARIEREKQNTRVAQKLEYTRHATRVYFTRSLSLIANLGTLQHIFYYLYDHCYSAVVSLS